MYIYVCVIVQELCGSRGGRPGLSVLTSFLVSVDVKRTGLSLSLVCQPTSEDIKQHYLPTCVCERERDGERDTECVCARAGATLKRSSLKIK